MVIDLHGKSSNEAMRLVGWVLERSASEVGIITGRGLHSPNGKPVIKPKVESYLNRNGYWWHHPAKDKQLEQYPSVKMRNTGMYIVSDLTR